MEVRLHSRIIQGFDGHGKSINGGHDAGDSGWIVEQRRHGDDAQGSASSSVIEKPCK